MVPLDSPGDVLEAVLEEQEKVLLVSHLHEARRLLVRVPGPLVVREVAHAQVRPGVGEQLGGAETAQKVLASLL